MFNVIKHLFTECKTECINIVPIIEFMILVSIFCRLSLPNLAIIAILEHNYTALIVLNFSVICQDETSTALVSKVYICQFLEKDSSFSHMGKVGYFCRFLEF